MAARQPAVPDPPKHTEALMADVDTATGRLLDTAARLDDEAVAAPSALPGWTRGHVLTHLARNADALGNLLDSARTGERLPMYPSRQARNDDIEASAGRGAAAQLTDLRASVDRLATGVRDLPAEDWGAPVIPLDRPQPAWTILVLRLCEVELHHVDLATGYAPADWAEDFVRIALGQTATRRAGGGAGDGFVATLHDTDSGAEWRFGTSGPAIAGPATALLAWLTGRGVGDALTVTPPGTLPEPPPWP